MPNGLCPNLNLSGPTYATFRSPRLPVLPAGNSITISCYQTPQLKGLGQGSSCLSAAIPRANFRCYGNVESASEAGGCSISSAGMRFGHSQYSKTAHTRMNTQVVLTPKITWREVSRFERAIVSIEQIVPSEEVQNCIDRGRQGSSDGNQGSLVVFPVCS